MCFCLWKMQPCILNVLSAAVTPLKANDLKLFKNIKLQIFLQSVTTWEEGMKSLILIGPFNFALLKGARLKSKMTSDKAGVSLLARCVWHQGMMTWAVCIFGRNQDLWTYSALDIDLIQPQTHELSTFIFVLPRSTSHLDMSYPALFLPLSRCLFYYSGCWTSWVSKKGWQTVHWKQSSASSNFCTMMRCFSPCCHGQKIFWGMLVAI